MTAPVTKQLIGERLRSLYEEFHSSADVTVGPLDVSPAEGDPDEWVEFRITGPDGREFDITVLEFVDGNAA